ncbi:MAG: 3-deoxy-8-phosphooctulonate synthase [Thermodesulfobacteriota bacterium]|nr:3-deoxy-8-phosphooctulonate synthase [Thermodesulfobacteriota bacterium]
MLTKVVDIYTPISGNTVKIGGGNPVVLIAGPCVIEDHEKTIHTARRLKEISSLFSVPLIFKSSYDKANRTSLHSYRGPGLEDGLKTLRDVREKVGIPVTSDVHRFEEINLAAHVLDLIQVPAFLCRQTDLIIEIAKTKKAVNIKKGQFLAPWDMENVVEKVESCGNQRILLTERGSNFGYNNLVVDMRSLAIMRGLGYPVVFDATHSVQLPGGKGTASGGQREFVPQLSRAAIAFGIDAIFMEVHENPDQALCDGPNSISLDSLPDLLKQIRKIDDIVKEGMTH